jgi:hypothetical protein
MQELQVDFIAFLAALEFALLGVVVATLLGVRGQRLARRLRALQEQARASAAPAETVSYAQYLRDEVLRNQELIDRASAAEDAAEAQAAGLLAMRKRFLELELEARDQEGNPVAFQAQLAAGMNALIEALRPEPATISAEPGGEGDGQDPQSSAPLDQQDEAQQRATHDTHDEELDHLRQVINNQQDAMDALRSKLREHEAELEGVDDVLEKLDEFEKRSAELQRSLHALEEENQRLKVARAEGRAHHGTGEPARLDGLRSMVSDQQNTIGKLQQLVRALAPEAGKAKELADALRGMQEANQELNACVAVLEDENALLRSELEELQAATVQLEGEDEGRASVETVLDNALQEQNQELQVKLQEMEALLEFKDAAIQELEKQYNILESKYLTATGQKQA